MLDRAHHERIMSAILFDIYADKILRTHLGFKGGTACYLFYDLPRFSTDLDFNIIDDVEHAAVHAAIGRIASQYGTIKDAYRKRNTLFTMLSYSERSHNVKIEISTRPTLRSIYELRAYRGASFLVMRQKYISAYKFIALTDRRTIVHRDIFDVHFMLKNEWPIDTETIVAHMRMPIADYYSLMAQRIEREDITHPLQGIGELLDTAQKQWVRERLIPETIYLLRVRAAAAQKSRSG